MKKTLLAYLAFGAMATACSDNNEPGGAEEVTHPAEFSPSYIAFNLSSPVAGLSRAESWDYTDGSDNENAISTALFYFFDSNGDIVKLRTEADDDTFRPVFEFDFTSTGAEGEDLTRGSNVEKMVSVVMCAEFERSIRPASLVVIINPDTYVRNLDVTSAEILQDAVSNFHTGLTDGNFLMSNSVYVVESGETRSTVCPVALDRSSFYSTYTMAVANPVDVYVERVVARLDLSFEPDGDNLKAANLTVNGVQLPHVYETGVTYTPQDDSSIEKEIYVQLLGWGMTSTPKKSRLLKSVDSGWDSKTLFTKKPWNTESDHRSFWAINPPEPDYSWLSFNEITGLGDNGERGYCALSMDVNTTYLQENANPYREESVKAENPEYPTKLICAARLIDEEGREVTVVEYESNYYTLDGLTRIVANSLNMYCLTPEEGQNTYTKILPADLDFETSMAHNSETGPESEDTYYVYFTLSERGKSKRWYKKSTQDGEDLYTEITDPQTTLDDNVYPVKIWRDGYTYYFFDIPHCGEKYDDPGYFGIVRNNLYDAKVVKLSGLGTPVYEPDEKIYPEKPRTSGNAFEATVSVVQWRLVNQKFQLSW